MTIAIVLAFFVLLFLGAVIGVCAIVRVSDVEGFDEREGD